MTNNRFSRKEQCKLHSANYVSSSHPCTSSLITQTSLRIHALSPSFSVKYDPFIPPSFVYAFLAFSLEVPTHHFP